MARPKTLEEVKRLVNSVDLLIYAPPAYGKTAYQTNRRRQLDLSVFDTDDLDCPEDSDLEVLITNYHQLIPDLKSQLVIAFVPSEQQFRKGCEYRGLKYKQTWYTDVLDSLQRAGSEKDIIIINSGVPILFYDRFIHSCIMAVWDCGPLPSVPLPPKDEQKPVTHTKTQVIVDEDTLDPKVVKVVVPITPGPQLMYQDDDLEDELDDICADIQASELPTSVNVSPPVERRKEEAPKKRRLSDSDLQCSKKVKYTPQASALLSEKGKRFTARIFSLLCELQLPPFEWSIPEDYQVTRGNVKFKSFGSFVTCTNGTFQFHCSRHLFLKWSH